MNLNRLIYEDIYELYKQEGGIMFLANFERKAMEQGRLEGIKEGLKKGRLEGLEKGLMNTARKMMEDKIDIELILQYTGLTMENIKKIFQEESKEKE